MNDAAPLSRQDPYDGPERRNLLNLLNKITPTRFDRHCDLFLSRTRIGSSDALLRSAVRGIAERAADDARYAPMFAKLCVRLAAVPAEELGGAAAEGATQSFGEALLDRCRAVLLGPAVGDDLVPHAADANDPEELGWRDIVRKRRYVGHARFLGEIYLKGLIDVTRTHDILGSLLSGALSDAPNTDELMLEACVVLLGTCGSELEKEGSWKGASTSVVGVGSYIATIEMLVREQDEFHLSSRMKFALRDLLEMRENDWVMRRKQLVATTISHIRKEARKVRPIR